MGGRETEKRGGREGDREREWSRGDTYYIYYVCKCIERGEEGEVEQGDSLSLSLSLYIYIYIYSRREGGRERET